MGVIISGTPYTATIAAPDKPTLAANLKAAFLAAGYTLVANPSAMVWTMESPAGAQGLKIRFGCLDDGSDRLRFQLHNASSSITYNAGHLQATGTLTYQAIITPATFAIFELGASSHYRFLFGAQPAQPAGISYPVTEASFLQGNHNDWSNAYDGSSFRSGTMTGSDLWQAWNMNGSFGTFWHGGSGMPQIWIPWIFSNGNNAFNGWGRRFWGGDFPIVDPWLCAGLTGNSEIRIMGQLQDCFWSYEVYAADTQKTISGKTYWAITNNYSGSYYGPGGTLFLRSA